MAKLTPDATRTEHGLVINEKIIPWGAVWPKDSGAYKKGAQYKADRLLSGGTGKVKGVTIHNTNDLKNVEEDAEQYTRATWPNANMNDARVHYYVDDINAWQNLREDEVGWHAGDGRKATGGNETTLSIEIIMDGSGSKEDLKAEENGVLLAALLLKKHGLSVNELYTHNHWMGHPDSIVQGARKNCPLYILPHWAQFKQKVAAKLTELNGGATTTEAGKTEIMGKAKASAQQMALFARSKNAEPQLPACSLEQLAQFFLEEGEAEGVRGDVAFAQSLHETGFFKYGDIPQMSGSMANYTFGDTPSADANKLQWVKIKDGDKTLLICDRVILVSVSWDDLNGQGYVTGKTITIDGAKYKCRLLTGGSNRRNNDWYAGGTPTNNEWDRFITREEVITGLPAPVSSDLDTNLNTTDHNSPHNQLWHWAGVYSWCQETWAENASYRAVRGYLSARRWISNDATYSYLVLGFRPVLEILNTDPLISDSDRDLGDKNSNFTITYTVDDADSGDVLTATESLDGQTTKSFAPTRNLVNTISVDVDSLSLGKHTVKVVVSDGQGGTATRTWTFTRTNSAPTISGSDGNLGDKNLGFTYAYTIDDADGDTLTVVEELNDETIRTINNAPKGEELTVTITSEKLYALGLNSVNTLKITVTDGKGGTAYRRVTFKRTNSAPTISGQDKALGLKNGSFAENYTVSDVEGDNVVVTEFVDDVQIRSYQATLGQQETIELTREKWLSLTNGQHQLRIEAVDGNFATSVRVFSFSKKETVIKFELVAPEETDAAATKVLVTPTWKIEGAVAKVEACNNGFDAVPTWEDITAMVQINRVYNFTNKTKTASKWGVNIRFTITKNEGFEGEVSISGFGGAYE